MEKEKHYKLKPIPGMWGILTIITIGLAIACFCGAPIPWWWVFVPLGAPIAMLVGLPIYALVAVVVLALLALAFILIGLVPILIIAILFGIQEKGENE